MQDKLLIVSKIKKSIDYVDKVLINFPNSEHVIKNNIISSYYELLELAFKANIHKDPFYMRECIVKIRMIEYYIKVGFEKKLISLKKYENIGKHLLETNKMIVTWANNEKNKQFVQ